MGKVLIPQDVVEKGKELLRKHGHTVLVGSAYDVETIKREVVDCDAILARTAPFPAEVLEAGKKLKVIARHGVGVDNIDVDKATELGIKVTYTPEANANTVAELALGFIVALARNMVRVDKATRAGDFAIRNRLKGSDLSGKTLAVIGLGRIGRLVSNKARLGLDMKIIGYDPYVTAENAPEGVELVHDWGQAFSQADFVSLHLPSTPETKGIINRKTIELMKPTAYLINCARGDLMVESEIAEALKEGVIAGMATDVFGQEPPEDDHPFFKLDNVIMTPHNAALTNECMTRMATQAAEGIIAVLDGKKPVWSVN
jgi:D-3-phosphoglycerate dehydrogenase